MAWGVLRHEKPRIELFYAGHGSHPSPAGSYLTACVLYATIFHQSPAGLPSRITGTPVNFDKEKPEMGKSVALVDLNGEDAETLQKEAWDTWQRMASAGGYPETPPPQPPTLQPLPVGLPLSRSALEGTWEGTILFYPVGPAVMVLHIQSTQGWKAQLEIRYHSKDFPDESIGLSDFRIQGRRLSFSNPKSVGAGNLTVYLTGVMPTWWELQGTAEASRENASGRVVLLGSWSLKRVMRRSESAPKQVARTARRGESTPFP
jgi:hypothetical protein